MCTTFLNGVKYCNRLFHIYLAFLRPYLRLVHLCLTEILADK